VTDPERVVVTTRVATNHPTDAYGGVQDSDALLEALAKWIRQNKMPLVVHHDPMQPLDAVCLGAEVVGIGDGYKAVEADLEVNADAWEAFEAQRKVAGAPVGISFTYIDEFLQIGEGSPRIRVAADAAHFTDDDIGEAATTLSVLGPLQVGRLYECADRPTCRIIIEYVLQDGSIPLIQEDMTTISAPPAIFAFLMRLLARSSRSSPGSSHPETTGVTPQIEFHTKTDSDGSTSQVLKVGSDNNDVIRAAVDAIAGSLPSDEPLLEWNADSGDWEPPVP
jgi:hypothetical protein